MKIDVSLILLLAKIDMDHPNEPLYLIDSNTKLLPCKDLSSIPTSNIEDSVNELIFEIFNFETKWLGKSKIPLKKVKDKILSNIGIKKVYIIYGTMLLVPAEPQEPFKWIPFTKILEDETFDSYELEIINEVGQIL